MLGLVVVLPEQAPVLLQAAAIEAVLLPVAQSAAAVGQGVTRWQLRLICQTAMLQGSCRAVVCQQLNSTLRDRAAPVGAGLLLKFRTLPCMPEYSQCHPRQCLLSSNAVSCLLAASSRCCPVTHQACRSSHMD